MRIGFVELVLLLFIASLTVGPNVALFVDRWLRRAQRTSAAAARRKAQLEAQAAIEREALLTRFRVASNVFALLLLAALAYGLLLRPIETPPKAYTVPDVRVVLHDQNRLSCHSLFLPVFIHFFQYTSLLPRFPRKIS